MGRGARPAEIHCGGRARAPEGARHPLSESPGDVRGTGWEGWGGSTPSRQPRRPGPADGPADLENWSKRPGFCGAEPVKRPEELVKRPFFLRVAGSGAAGWRRGRGGGRSAPRLPAMPVRNGPAGRPAVNGPVGAGVDAVEVRLAQGEDRRLVEAAQTYFKYFKFI